MMWRVDRVPRRCQSWAAGCGRQEPRRSPDSSPESCRSQVRRGRISSAPGRTASGRLPVTTNVSFLGAKRVAPRPARPTASGNVERRQWVGSASSPQKTAVVRTSSTGLGARRVGCTSLTGRSPGRVGAGPMAGMRRTPCV